MWDREHLWLCQVGCRTDGEVPGNSGEDAKCAKEEEGEEGEEQEEGPSGHGWKRS